jgi:hypothetical protein
MELKYVIGFIFIISGIFDSWKYHWESDKIREVKTAKGHSRKFINVAILSDLVKLFYAICINDLFITFSACVALGFMIELFVMIYFYYPYKHRKAIDFVRPNIFIYTINSLLPNKIRRKL